MDIKLAPSSLAETRVGLVALPVFEEDLGKKGASAEFDSLDVALGGVLREIAKQEGFTGKAGSKLVVHTHGKLPATNVILIGLGTNARAELEGLRKAAGIAAKEGARVNAGKIAFAVPGLFDTYDEARAAAEGLQLGAYRYDKWRSKKDDDKKELKAALITSPAYKKNADAEAGLALGLAVAEGVNFARDLVNEPAMTMTPTMLAQAAQKKLKVPGLTVTVHDRKKIEQLKMGMFLGVAQGSREEPKLIEIRYTPKGGARGAAAKSQPLALVGKAITFDSGGLSLKPADGMVDMKTDMAGSAAVFGAMWAIATEVKPNFPIHAYVGTCENMPSGTAYRPGDVLTARNGKTVEITNTDAEGRLVLGDVLTYAVEQSKPRCVIDLATLTGACIVALGNYTVGTWSNEDEWADRVIDASKAAGESFWHMPLIEDVKDNLKSPIADMKNSGSRWGGAISASLFLREFVEGAPWVHLDIAGPSTSDKEGGYQVKGGTGVGVRTLVDLVRSLES